MAALTDNLQLDRQEGSIVAYDMGVDIVYRGGLVTLNTSGYAVAGQDTAGNKFVGVAYEKKDNSGGSAGDIKVRVHRDGVFFLAGSGFAITDVGKPVYLVDDQTVSLTQQDGFIPVGKIVEYVSSTEVGVDIGAVLNDRPDHEIILTGDLTAATTTDGGDVLNLANPFGETVYVDLLVLDITTPATGAANADCGIAASATSDDTLMDGVDIGTAAILANNRDNPGTNGVELKKWTSSQYITVSNSASAAGLVGTYWVRVLRTSAQ